MLGFGVIVFGIVKVRFSFRVDVPILSGLLSSKFD